MYRITCHDHIDRVTHSTEVQDYAVAKKLGYRATHATKVLSNGRKVVRALPHRELVISYHAEGTYREVIRYLGNHMVTRENRAAKMMELGLGRVTEAAEKLED